MDFSNSYTKLFILLFILLSTEYDHCILLQNNLNIQNNGKCIGKHVLMITHKKNQNNNDKMSKWGYLYWYGYISCVVYILV